MSIIIPEKLPDCVDSAVNNVAGPISKNVGETINDIFYLVFGGINNCADKMRIKRQLEIEDFKQKIESKRLKIPENRIIEPDLQITGQALEKSQYCICHEELREMFANLITASIDSSKAYMLHPCFADMLSQMSPLDAQNFKLFLNEKQYPLCKYIIKNLDSTYHVIQENIFISNQLQNDLNAQSVSISALIRLGVINADYMQTINDEKIYEPFKKTSMFVDLCNQLTNYSKNHSKNQVIDKINGMIFITPIGENLLTSIIDNDVISITDQPSPPNLL